MSGEYGAANGPMDVFRVRLTPRDQLVARFEESWRHGDEPHIEDFVVDQKEPRQLLQELVRVEMACRLKAGEPARVEEYLERFPTLTEDEEYVVKLIRDEHCLRRLREKELSSDEYLNHRARFCDMCRRENSKSEILNPKQIRMTETQMAPTGGSSTRGSSEENDDGRFEHSDIRILNLFRISDFVLRICCPPRSRIASVM